jgi:hypothetical protein
MFDFVKRVFLGLVSPVGAVFVTNTPEDLKKLPGEWEKVQGGEVTIKFKDSVKTFRDGSYVRVE